METSKHIRINDLKSIWPIIRRRKWLIILPFILVSGIVAAGSFLMTPVYEAGTIVSIDTQVQLSEELQRLIGRSRSYYSRADRSDQLRGIFNEITSTRYVSLLDERLHLSDEPEIAREAAKVTARVPGMRRERAVLDILQNRLRKQISIQFAASDQIRVGVESPRPAEAQDIANTLAEIFISERHKQEMASIRSSQDFSDIQFQKYEKLVEDKVAEKTQFEKDFMKIQLDESITSDSNRSEITAEIDRTNNDIEEFRGQERDLLAKLVKESDLSTNSLSLNESDKVTRTKEELKEQLRNISNLMIRYTWSDPQILNNKLKQNNLIKSVEEENERLVKQQYSGYSEDVQGMLVNLFKIRANLDYLYSKDSYLRSALDELTDKMNLIPEYQAKLNRLNQEIATATELRDKFKKQQESSSISQALLQDMSSSKYQVVEPAKIPFAPVKPDRIRIILLGIILGIAIGAAAATVAELMDSSFKNVEDVQEYLDLPVIGVTPKIEFLKRVAK